MEILMTDRSGVAGVHRPPMAIERENTGRYWRDARATDTRATDTRATKTIGY